MSRPRSAVPSRALVRLLACVALGFGFASAPADLDVALPPGSPLEWSAFFPAYTPPRVPLFPETATSAEGGARSSAKQTFSEANVRLANAFGQVRILTWDLGAHLPWSMKTSPPPTTGRSSARPPPPQYGDPLYWISLAPFLRLLLHPDALSRAETLAHLVEIGEPTLAVLGAASGEKELAPVCRELRALIPVDQAPLPSPPASGTPRERGLARVVLEECVRDEPLDPSDDFARRLYLFAPEAEPLLMTYTRHPSLTLARNAITALGRYEDKEVPAFLVSLAARVEDPVSLVRALAALGRYRGPIDVAPLLERLGRTREPVARAALVGALGRMGARDALGKLLELGEAARAEKDADLLISVLSALAHIAWSQTQPKLFDFGARIVEEAKELGRPAESVFKADLPDGATLRAQLLATLALCVQSQAAPLDEKVRTKLLELAEPAPLDARLSPLGVGGEDPLGTIPTAARFLYLEALTRVGPAGFERLAVLQQRAELEPALRGHALALLPYDRRGPAAEALLLAPGNPVELRIQALEVLIRDAHPKAEERCRTALASAELAAARPSAGVLYLAQRAVRELSERGKLTVRELLPLYGFVKRPLREREAHVLELRAALLELAKAARGGQRTHELKARAGELFDFVFEHQLNALLMASMRAEKIDALVQALDPARARDAAEAVAETLVPVLLQVLLGGEAQDENVQRILFEPYVPLAEEVLLALGRTRDPLAQELLLPALHGAGELRAHACLALGMCGVIGASEPLLPVLLDEDPFVRFCAAESLRHLWGQEHALDWTSATGAERAAAAEELRQKWLARER